MSSKQKQYPNTPEVRAWLDERYFGVPKRGRLPAWGIEAWDSAHPKRKYVESEAYHGTTGGYTHHGCREDCCRLAFYAYYGNLAAGRQAA